MKIRISQEYEIEDGKVPSLLSSEVLIVQDGTTLLLQAIEWIEAVDRSMIICRSNKYVAYKANPLSDKFCIILTPIGNELQIAFDSETKVTFSTHPDSDFDYAKYTTVKDETEMSSVLTEIMGLS